MYNYILFPVDDRPGLPHHASQRDANEGGQVRMASAGVPQHWLAPKLK